MLVYNHLFYQRIGGEVNDYTLIAWRLHFGHNFGRCPGFSSFLVSIPSLCGNSILGYGIIVHTSTSLLVLPQQLFNALDNSTLLSIPFFNLAGSVMTAVHTHDSLLPGHEHFCGGTVHGRGNARSSDRRRIHRIHHVDGPQKKLGRLGEGRHKGNSSTLREGIWGLMLPAMVLGGIYGGLFTPFGMSDSGYICSRYFPFFTKNILTMTVRGG